MNKCTKKRERDIRNLTVASKDIQLEKNSTQKCPWSSSTAPLQSSAFHSDVHNMPWATAQN